MRQGGEGTHAPRPARTEMLQLKTRANNPDPGREGSLHSEEDALFLPLVLHPLAKWAGESCAWAMAPRAGKGTRAGGEEIRAHLPCPWGRGSAKPPCPWRSGSPPQRERATRARAPGSPLGLGPGAVCPPRRWTGSPSLGRCPGCSGESSRPAAPRSGHRNPASCSRRRPPRCRTCRRTSAAGPGRWCPAWPGTRADRLRGSCPSLCGPRPWLDRDSGPRVLFPRGGKGSRRQRAPSHSDWGGRRRLSLRARGGSAAPVPASPLRAPSQRARRGGRSGGVFYSPASPALAAAPPARPDPNVWPPAITLPRRPSKGEIQFGARAHTHARFPLAQQRSDSPSRTRLTHTCAQTLLYTHSGVGLPNTSLSALLR